MAKTLKSILISYVTLVSSIFMCQCDSNGFTTELIHRDSPESPFYDPSATPWQRVADAKQRSLSRAKYINDTLHNKTPVSIVSALSSGQYLMRFYMGSPPKHVIAVVDTGSYLTWTQCSPCKKCMRQLYPIFDPNSSHSYKEIRCNSESCSDFEPSSTCDKRKEKCLYIINYGDGSYSHGAIASETFSFRSTKGGMLYFNNIIFGCGTNNYFKVKNIASGIVGLAGGSSSLVQQLGYGQFAYCLMPSSDHNKSRKLHFGRDAVVFGKGVATTPLGEGNRHDYYYLTLKAISVGNHRFEYHSPLLITGGNIIIDSGAFLTYLPVNFYDKLEVAIANSIEARAVRNFRHWRLCYSSPFVMPKITVHFKGADVEWKDYNAFVRVNDDYMCLALEPMEGLPIYGNVAQANFLVGYDIYRSTVSFKRTECGIH